MHDSFNGNKIHDMMWMNKTDRYDVHHFLNVRYDGTLRLSQPDTKYQEENTQRFDPSFED